MRRPTRRVPCSTRARSQPTGTAARSHRHRLPDVPVVPGPRGILGRRARGPPLISCEYAYSHGNSTGGLAHYWHLFETSPALQGGFIWQFLDHALDPTATALPYGGDFGDKPNDGAVLLCGIAFADLTPKPALYEARGLFSPVRIESDAAEARCR